VSLAWRPFLLGPIFAAQGWRDSPFNIYPNKGRYMWRDLERTCAAMGIPLVRPEPFPQASLLAARVALALEDEARAEFSREVYMAEFGRGLPIADRATIASLLAACRIDPAAALERAESDPNKAALKAECARATEIGIVGAPSM
jgi:2-hydroxychromene-2-carboxylate isomerase